MLLFTTTIERFAEQGEKTGWTYIIISPEQAQTLQPNNNKSFRVKGLLDNTKIEAVALLPMGNNSFIMALNADIRKALKKRKGDTIKVAIELDKTGYILNQDFMACLQDETAAINYFNTLTKGHQNYFSKWIESAKTDNTKTKRMAMAINALANKMGYPEMIRHNKKQD